MIKHFSCGCRVSDTFSMHSTLPLRRYRKKQQEVAVVKLEKVNNKEYVQRQNMLSLKEKKAKREAIKRHEEVSPDREHYVCALRNS